MKALTLYQPWASLVSIGAKRIETRSWATRYRGPLAIHAAKVFPKWARELCSRITFSEVLFSPEKHCYTSSLDLPFGAIVATCILAECCRIGEDGLYRLDSNQIDPPKWFAPLPGYPEICFGDYTPGRFAWLFKDMQPLPEPIPASGHQGLWSWESPEVIA
ncbi:MAG: hypothetical protein JL50_03085 [Peptococcaceae bacterium BICA1-7]|nr:MAG: hypothetical protein JL50_03085 [Peptococcaceae bacterium BICA1-7]HBV97751.1 ASCH domain-containing protein [Desulfotomaculum sp.]